MSELSEYPSRLEAPTNDGAVLSLYRDTPYPEGYVELGEIEGHTPYGPTPCRPFAPENRPFQAAILDNLAALAAVPYPEDTPTPVVLAVASDFMSGFVRREEKNHQSYLRWSEFGGKNGSDEITVLRQDDYFADIITRAECGKANAFELIQLMKNSTLHSTNLASMAIPYGRRTHYVPEMRNSVNEAILAHGGTIYDPETTKYRKFKLAGEHTHEPEDDLPKTQDDIAQREIDVLMTTYLRDVGEYYAHDGTLCKVVERQAVVIRTDEESGFPQDLRKMLNEDSKSDDFIQAWEYVCEAYLQTNAEELFIIPASISTFTHRDESKPKLTVEMLAEYQLQKEAREAAAHEAQRLRTSRLARVRQSLGGIVSMFVR